MNTADGRISRIPALVGMLMLAFLLDAGTSRPRAMDWAFNGVMPDVGEMSYDLVAHQPWGQPGLGMTGYASSKGGMVRWVHCQQLPATPLRACQLMVNGETSGPFPLPPQVDLAHWMSRSSGLGWIDRMVPDIGPRLSFETSGTFSWSGWRAQGRIRYSR